MGLEGLIHRMHILKLAPGAVVVSEDESAGNVYVVSRGHCRFFKTVENNVEKPSLESFERSIHQVKAEAVDVLPDANMRFALEGKGGTYECHKGSQRQLGHLGVKSIIGRW